MTTVDLILPHHRYAIHIGPGLLGELGKLTREVAPHDKASLFIDDNVFYTHGKPARASLEDGGYTLLTKAVSAGEDRKNLDTVRDLYNAMLDQRLERKSPAVALGGGMVGDTVGFVAATYLRGVPFVQCPTTLLAMVDASVGGKTGVNVPQGKNLIGAFHQPVLVCIDIDTLKTLPPRELRCGLAECVKHGMIRDAGLFDWIADNVDRILALDEATMVELVERNVKIKADVVQQDEKEAGLRAILNFGHTFAHAIEVTAGYGSDGGYHHGEAVSLGMVAATRLAIEIGRCEESVLAQLVNVLDAIGLPTHAENLASTDRLLDAMRLDKKVAAGAIRLVLPDGIGAVSIVKGTPDNVIAEAWESLRQSQVV